MKIICWEPKKFRVEYQDRLSEWVGSLYQGYHPRTWRIYHEDMREAFTVRTLADFALLGIDIPYVVDIVSFVLREARADVIELRPYEPVDVDEQIVGLMGTRFVERVLEKDRECKVWHLKNGFVWLHMPGDEAR